MNKRMGSYYEKQLAAERLKRCYDIAPPRVNQYFAAEIDHVLRHLKAGDRVLDLGCGYGRIIPDLAHKVGIAGQVVGVDISRVSLEMARRRLAGAPNCLLMEMDARRMAFADGAFDVTICIQNGISAFHTDPRRLIEESLRVTCSGGLALFSTYAEKFWPDRLAWFRLQAQEGLVGEIDDEKTGNGVIVCKDGFRATTFSAGQFQALTADLAAAVRIAEVDESSLFCEIVKQ